MCVCVCVCGDQVVGGELTEGQRKVIGHSIAQSLADDISTGYSPQDTSNFDTGQNE